MKWDKTKFVSELRKKASREVAKIGESLCDFAEKDADEVSWGRGDEYGTMTYKSKSDFGLISVFQITSKGQIKFCLNLFRQKGVPKNILRDYLIKLESNFLRDYDPKNYPIDSLEDMGELFSTGAQLDKLIHCIEGIAYRLRQ
ncbi:MAG: hypothetical protein VX822_00910 [Candidatus Neomarinimicrobiota bacterium]|nr:hypothetical protein [Candidatus Neomarinimicrobiota bacterium]